ncbi:histidine kinase [Cytophagaceae bacterium YF14B1]|uniref:Histidine kinase n=1 Tax=Xanthocytophaga flava TaxID=3048013 RepID=A0AAE3QYF8_9BACT|nr:histidine kinase [Xanthocytophaga flavus]MDJ1485064.1 histidine kinase [Xanthocytophaga flavus]
MILGKYLTSSNRKSFTVSSLVIWVSAFVMGVLASIPKILRLNISFREVAIDSLIAFSFSLFVWYYNLFTLPRVLIGNITTRFFGLRLVKSLALGIIFMAILVIINQLFFSSYGFGSMILMYQFRGILINLTIYLFLYLLYQSYANQVIAVELERIKSDHLAAQFELLKQQINPHFLFNSLNTLKSMVDIGDEHASDFIVKLSNFYRASLDTKKLDVVSMEEELKLLDSFFFLLHARFEEGIHIDVKLTVGHKASFVPPFVLQLLVENAVKHNVVAIDMPLHIEIFSDEDYIVVQNNLQVKSLTEPSTNLGLQNVNQRYQHITGMPIIVNDSGKYFTVKLPVYENFSR